MRRRTTTSEAPVETSAGVAEVERVLALAVSGELEARAQVADDDSAAVIAAQLNAFLDIVEAFVRESGAVLEAAARGTYYRRFLTRGMPGSFQDRAAAFSHATMAMQTTAEQLEQQSVDRRAIADTALDGITSVAGAATELSASASALAGSVSAAVAQSDEAMATVTRLQESSDEIQDAVKVITQVAAQTRLLALNATIESARAGEAGKGFAVVAAEVKGLADETARSSSAIAMQVEQARQAAQGAGAAISAISGVIGEIESQVHAVAEAAGGEGGLSGLAEVLTHEIGHIANL